MSKKLLIVDDSRGNSELYRIRFEFDNWEVKIAYSAEKALEILKEGDYRPDAMLLDLMLPKMQGDELLEVIRNNPKLKDIAVIVLTALSLNREDEERISGEADDYISKTSITPQELVKRVNTLLASRAK